MAACDLQFKFKFQFQFRFRSRRGVSSSSSRVVRVWASTGMENTKKKKEELYSAVQGLDRGIFGAPSAKKEEIQRLVGSLEAQNPTPSPTQHDHLCQKVDGCWKLVYSTVSITGSKRTKLGLRGFITLGDFLQIIHVEKGKAINLINFNAKGFNFLSGQLTIVASFTVASTTRVDIKYEGSHISPPQLREVFQKNYDVLLAIFNPDGWLHITYLDESMRIGRDDKGNIFVMERFNQHH